MTTHPPGQPDGPTGPGRTAIPAGPVLDEADQILELHGNGIGEPNEYSTPPLPRLGEVLRDAERLIRCALTVLDRQVDPGSYPDGRTGHLADAGFEVAGYHLEAAMRELGTIAALPLPAVGSAIKLPVAAGKEPTPGSAASIGVAARESTGALVAPGAGNTPDPSPGSGAPVSPPARGVGPGLLGAAPYRLTTGRLHDGPCT